MAVTVFPIDAVAGQPEYSAREARQALVVDLAGATSTRPLGARSGVRPGTPSTTISATSTTWTVKPHAGVLDAIPAAEASAYRYAIDADVTGAMTAAHATLPRKDLLYVELSDPAESAGSTPEVVVKYLAGTAATARTQVVPATPARSMRLGYVDVPQVGGGSPVATFDAPYVVGPGWAVGAEITSSVASGTSYTVIATAPAVIADGLSRFRISAGAYSISSASGGSATFAIFGDGVLIQSRNVIIPAGGSSEGVDIFRSLIPAAGPHVYSLRVAGSAAHTVFGSASSPIEILVEQLT